MNKHRELSAAEILKKPYRRLLTPEEGGGYVSTIHEFPGCVAYGKTPNKALTALESAAEAWIEAALESGYPVPEPATYDDFSGKIALRISRRLHKMAAERAQEEATSINQLLSSAIAHYLGQTDALAKSLEKIDHACRSNFKPHNVLIAFSMDSKSFTANTKEWAQLDWQSAPQVNPFMVSQFESQKKLEVTRAN